MDITEQMSLFLEESEKEVKDNSQAEIEKAVLSNLPRAYDDFDYEDVRGELTVLVMIPVSDLMQQEIDFIETVRKYDPGLIEELTSGKVPDFYEFGTHDALTDEEVEMLEYNEGFNTTEEDDDIPFFQENSIFLQRDTPTEKCEIFIYSSNDNIVPINDKLYTYSHMPSLEGVLLNNYNSKDISDFNHEVTDISNNYISISSEGAQKLLDKVTNLLVLYEALDDVAFINEYSKVFGLNGEDFPYYTSTDIEIIGEFLDEFSKLLDSFLSISIGEKTFFQLVYTVEG